MSRSEDCDCTMLNAVDRHPSWLDEIRDHVNDYFRMVWDTPLHRNVLPACGTVSVMADVVASLVEEDGVDINVRHVHENGKDWWSALAARPAISVHPGCPACHWEALVWALTRDRRHESA